MFFLQSCILFLVNYPRIFPFGFVTIYVFPKIYFFSLHISSSVMNSFPVSLSVSYAFAHTCYIAVVSCTCFKYCVLCSVRSQLMICFPSTVVSTYLFVLPPVLRHSSFSFNRSNFLNISLKVLSGILSFALFLISSSSSSSFSSFSFSSFFLYYLLCRCLFFFFIFISFFLILPSSLELSSSPTVAPIFRLCFLIRRVFSKDANHVPFFFFFY